MSYGIGLMFENVEDKTYNSVKKLFYKTLLPQTITRNDLISYLRRSLRNGSWKLLTKVERSILYLSTKLLHKVKSVILKRQLLEIMYKIELSTVKGRAIYYGILLALKRKLTYLFKSLENHIGHILYLGISYLNNPPVYRIYG